MRLAFLSLENFEHSSSRRKKSWKYRFTMFLKAFLNNWTYVTLQHKTSHLGQILDCEILILCEEKYQGRKKSQKIK
jgi:hypothetical protein